MKPKTITTWSFNRLKKYEACAFAAQLAYIDKIKEAPRAANHPAMRGISVHTEAEDFVTGRKPFTPNLNKMSEDFAEIRELYKKGKVEVEGDWAIDINWKQTGWFDSNCWGRMKLDAFVTIDKTSARVIDYKTGKRFGNEVSHAQQGQLYGIGAFMRHSNLQFIQTEFWYLDIGGQPVVNQYSRKQAMRYFKSFNNRALAMTTATTFPANPNIHNCRFCPFKPSELNKCPVGVG